MERTKILTNKWFSELSEDEQKNYRRELKLPITKDLVYYCKNTRFEVKDICVEKLNDEFSHILIKVPLSEDLGEPSSYQWVEEDSASMVVRIMNAYLIEMQQSIFLSPSEGNGSTNIKVNNEKKKAENDFGTCGRYKSLVAFPNNYVMVDIETNGKDCKKNEAQQIIELGAIRYEDGIETERYGTLVKPNKPIGEKTTNYTNITNEMLESAKEISVALAEFIDFVGDDYVVGYNIQSFDRKYIEEACAYYLDYEFDNCIVDIQRFVELFFKKDVNIKAVKKDLIAKYFSISTEGAHRAVQDCWIENQLFLHLKKVIIDKYGSYKKFASLVAQRKEIELLPCKEELI